MHGPPKANFVPTPMQEAGNRQTDRQTEYCNPRAHAPSVGVCVYVYVNIPTVYVGLLIQVVHKHVHI